MRGDRGIDAGSRRGSLHYAVHRALREWATLAAGKHRIIGAGIAAQGEERAANDVGQEHLALLPALAQDGELHLIIFTR
jgi:hypothetical protein